MSFEAKTGVDRVRVVAEAVDELGREVDDLGREVSVDSSIVRARQHAAGGRRVAGPVQPPGTPPRWGGRAVGPPRTSPVRLTRLAADPADRRTPERAVKVTARSRNARDDRAMSTIGGNSAASRSPISRSTAKLSFPPSR
jgi:hypothetical protein